MLIITRIIGSKVSKQIWIASSVSEANRTQIIDAFPKHSNISLMPLDTKVTTWWSDVVQVLFNLITKQSIDWFTDNKTHATAVGEI